MKGLGRLVVDVTIDNSEINNRKKRKEGKEAGEKAYSSDCFILDGLIVRVESTPVAIWMLSATVLIWSSMGSCDS